MPSDLLANFDIIQFSRCSINNCNSRVFSADNNLYPGKNDINKIVKIAKWKN